MLCSLRTKGAERVNYERLTLVLPEAEMQALRTAARAELRKPRDQARAILRAALLGGRAGPHQGENEIEGSTVVSQTGGATLFQS